ncbi:MAG: 8-amino-7-oxononanoate synthase [Nevskia sp.]|nr:8-amino-7-oxononanoate synthase [Nevskia sp.]
MVPPGLEQRLAAELQRLRAVDLYRVRRAVEGGHGVKLVVDGRACVNFCSNDYLGLAADPRLAEAARRALGTCGTGSGASALISGYNAEHARLEEELADFLQRPRALLFSSGWAANLGVLRALLSKNDTLVADELNHASLIDGGRLSGARYVKVPHRHVGTYERVLIQSRDPGPGTRDPGTAGHTMLVTDAVFSMDGDLAPLPELSRLCERHGATLMVDDAHGFGVLGDKGRGALELFPGPGSQVPGPGVYVATLGKSLGAAGAFVAGSDTLIEYLVQRARSWVFSTAPPPAIAAAARAALRIVRAEPERRQRLHHNVARFREGLEQLSAAVGVSRLPPPASHTPIQPLVLGAEARALALSRFLLERGYWVAAIRPPTVPRGTSRLRITLSAAHTPEQIDGLLNALAEGLRTVGRAVPAEEGAPDRPG